MNIENENFFDFFGLNDEELRSLYAIGGEILQTAEMHVPIPKAPVPENGLNGMVAISTYAISKMKAGII